MKNIFEYQDYREYLRDVYAFQKANNKYFSFRYFAKLAGFKAGNVLKLVIDGKQNIASYSIEKFTKALKLNKEESLFFRNLVLFNQATNSQERQAYAQELMKCRQFKKIYPMKESQFNYYLHWYFTPIRELVNLPEFQEDAHWISRRLTPAITAPEAKKALDELLKLGLLERDKAGKLRQAESHITTADEVSSAAVAEFTRQMLKLAAESIDRINRSKRDISTQTFGASEETARKIKAKIQNFRKEIIEMIDQDKDIHNCVYQLNFQLFPLVQPEGGGK
jgi:uncharacterized protein (TIGR02147 family)